ncbi:tetratricopeptide repeat protein [Aliikangiella sp. IMCC44359]|uniref:tetratricopeptide repeat protein n=1 Tax=Aliikangiella sp. IMCC44359 TaxID=3459125 RepID=UPI00403AC815
MKILMIVASLVVVAGCSTAPNVVETPVVNEKTTKPIVLGTEQYLPFIQIDENTGKRLPYIGEPNPYLKSKGQLEQTIVMKFIQARRAIKAKNFKPAEDLLNSIIKQNPQLSGPFVLLGDIEKQNNRLPKSIEYYKKAISVNSDNVNAYIRLATTQRESGLFKPAQNTYVKALEKWKDFPEAHLNLSVLYDVYLNQPNIAQKHMEAYQLLTKQRQARVANWLKDLQSRTKQDNYIELDARQKEKVILARIEAEKKAQTVNAELTKNENNGKGG